MERLTKRIKRLQKDDLIVYTKGKYEGAIPAEMTNDDIRAVLKKLATYEDLEEQGLLVRLPCKVGTVVYRIESCGWTKSSICGESFSEDCEYCEEKKCDSHRKYEIYSQEMISQDWIFGNRNGFGRTIFFTREEAEKKLEEMKK